AVLLLAYELRRASADDLEPAIAPEPGGGYANDAQMTGFYDHLERVLDDIEFLKAKPPTKILRKL
ncbi:MAG: RNA methyltransferase, partial [Actinobacteria bacterium]|nr:RNA methyltransferase [Actinomycetota bacterium]NIS33431.1 RNA methyltransferase [Actinomycetota bacterium]NIU68323.1 RNA methyltransferase [Actinomycetota bacterium]NIW30146.1 RNA methyltransferase [Actinomycetota bacterium]